MQSTGSDSQGSEIFGPPRAKQREPQALSYRHRKMGAACLPPVHSRRQEGHPTAPSRSRVPHRHRHQGRCQEPTSPSCFPKLSQGKAAGVRGSQRGTGCLPTPLSSATCRFPSATPMPHRLVGCSQCCNRQQTGWLETHLWQGKPLPSFQRGNNSQVPPSATAAAFHRAPASAPGTARSPTGSLQPPGANAAQQKQG